jgi:hypothetical protein
MTTGEIEERCYSIADISDLLSGNNSVKSLFRMHGSGNFLFVIDKRKEALIWGLT